MNDESPYQAPESQVLGVDNFQYADIDVFSATQRIGRVRFLAYNFVANLVLLVLIGIVAAITIPAFYVSGEGAPLTATILMIFFYLIPFAVSIIIARRRLHDLNQSGWLVLVYLVPLINLFFALYLLFAPGTKGSNQYGLQPKPNTILTWVLGLFAPIAIIAILAAITIPTYNDYVEKTKTTEGQ